jgi:hypothetical protein
MENEKRLLLAIDPGTEESAYCYVDMLTYKPILFGKIPNMDLLRKLIDKDGICPAHMAIEMVASYGMPVGKEVFETCVWIGRFVQAMDWAPLRIDYVYRMEERQMICHSSKARDANITQALIDRFAKGVSNHGKGTKKEPGWFYGFRKDIWQAYAVGVTYIDKCKEGR